MTLAQSSAAEIYDEETFSLCVAAVSFTQAGALETETYTLCLIAVAFTQEVALELYDRRISHWLIAWTFPQADAVEIYDQRLSHCVSLQCHLLKRCVLQWLRFPL